MKLFTLPNLLRLSTLLIFLGRAWQHLFWDAPYRSFFWDEDLLKPFIEGVFGMNWNSYVTSENTDTVIQNLIKGNGYLYLIAAIFTLALSRSSKFLLKIPVFLGGVSLVILTLLMTKEKFFHTAQFFEHSIQFSLPFLFLYSLSEKFEMKKALTIAKIFIALTFFSHGLYAFGVYPVPGKFVDMVINIFGFQEPIALTFLYIAGILDFVLAILIFVPKVDTYALWYAVIWGLLTALARIVANFYWDFALQSLHQHLYEVIYRLPHGLLPLWTIYKLKHFYPDSYKSKKTASAETVL